MALAPLFLMLELLKRVSSRFRVVMALAAGSRTVRIAQSPVNLLPFLTAITSHMSDSPR
jgi:hypothetical protein